MIDPAPVDIATRLKPLGFLRVLLLECLGGSSPRFPGYFVPAEDIDTFTAYRDHVMRLSQQWQAEPIEPMVVSLLAASRLLCGELAAADLILDHLPTQPHEHDKSIRYCPVLPVRAMAAALPLPPALKENCSRCWLAGSLIEAEVRAWLDARRNTLQWDEANGVYHSADLAKPNVACLD